MTTVTTDGPDTATLIEDLQQTAGEVRVRIHLAAMDLKDEWAKLEPHVREVEQDLASAATASRRGLRELVESVRRLRGALG